MMKLFTILVFAFAVLGLSAHGKGNMMKKHFQEMDTNGDGKVSKEEWAAFHETKFSSLDKDGDGFVSAEELKEHKKEKRQDKVKKK